ncbi:amino acid ABC transporter substrate-binding protein [Zooshikella sp. RANM57]|uniref:amino acid ABC transporter substrate-binding protein n=1 Tax=Zooshikella sp. RANM57 TaxID=3425863 RepID=UPI003D6F1035
MSNSMLQRTLWVLFPLMVMLSGCEQSSESATAEKTIRVGSSGSYYPFTFVEKDKLQGFEIDLWNEIGKRQGYKIEFVTAKFSGLFGMLETGKVDTISNQITITDEREKKYLFSAPYVYDGAQLVVHKDNTSIQGINDLVGKKVAVNLGSNFEQVLRGSSVGDQINVTAYDGGMEQDVAIGRMDAFMMDKVSVLALIKKSGLPLKLAGKPVETIANALPFKNNESGKKLQQQVNDALVSMRADGSLARISKRWFDADITAKP